LERLEGNLGPGLTMSCCVDDAHSAMPEEFADQERAQRRPHLERRGRTPALWVMPVGSEGPFSEKILQSSGGAPPDGVLE
jgi:hypothetical protein